MERFGTEWVERWRGLLNDSPAYRRAAAGWSTSLALSIADAEPARGVYVELDGGECHRALPLREAGPAAADYVLAAGEAVWDELLAGRLDPTLALLSGRLDVARGSVGALLPWARAAREMVRSAASIEPAPADGARAEPTPAPSPVAAGPAGRAFRTTAAGLDRDLFPMRLWERAKRRGVWNPAEIDFATDRADWLRLDAEQQDLLLRLSALFQAGEEAVTLDLLPLIQVVAAEGRLEEEIYLTSFLWEEAKHVDLFQRFLHEVAGGDDDLARYHTPAYRRIFYDELPAALGALAGDRSPAAQATASVTYNLVVEGVLAETGYHSYYSILDRAGILPGMRQAVDRLREDEARHLAYGVFLLTRLVVEHGEPVWQAIERQMGRLLEPALEIIVEAFAAYDPVPFDLDPGELQRFASSQFQKRLARVERARRQSPEEVLGAGFHPERNFSEAAS